MQGTTTLWLLAGAILCVSELFLPTQFIIFLMGISALVVAAISVVLPSLTLQITLWLLLSTIAVWLLKRLYTPKKNVLTMGDDQEGESLTAILPGKTGRILYEGNSWRAKLADPTCTIAPHEKVYIVRREGNTLIVVPEQLFKD